MEGSLMHAAKRNRDTSMKNSLKALGAIRKPHQRTNNDRPRFDLRDLVYPPQLHDKRFVDKFVHVFILFAVFGLGIAQACSPSLGPGLPKPESRKQELKSSSTTAGASVMPAAVGASV